MMQAIIGWAVTRLAVTSDRHMRQQSRSKLETPVMKLPASRVTAGRAKAQAAQTERCLQLLNRLKTMP